MGKPLTDEERQILEKLTHPTVRNIPKREEGREERVRQVLVQLTKNELTARQLYMCYHQANDDRYAHIRARHPNGEDAPGIVELSVRNAAQKIDYILSKVATPRGAVSSGSSDAQSRREVLLNAVAAVVCKYWSHMTEEHVAQPGSVEDYLKLLVKRIERTT